MRENATTGYHGRLELLLACNVGPTFQVSEKFDASLKDLLQTAVNSLEFQHAGLVLLPQGKPALSWHAEKSDGAENDIEQQLIISKFLAQAGKKSRKTMNMLEFLKPVVTTTLPVVLKSGEPVSIMEIGIFGTEQPVAQHMLVKAVSVARHIADILLESIMLRQKDPHLRKLAVWLEMINTISSTLDIREVLHVVCQLTADLFSAKSCIYLLDDKDQTLVPAVGVGSYDPDLKKKFKALRGTKPFPAITKVIESQQPVIVTPSNSKRLLTPAIVRDFAYCWMVLVPILSKDRIIGVMQVDRPMESGEFNQEETEIISAIARATAIAMENAKLIEMLGQKEQMLHQLVNKMIAAQEDERKRLAADLHDGIIQSLIAIWYRLQRISPSEEGLYPEWQTELKDLTGILNEQIMEIRRVLYDLRPIILDNYGLFPAVESYVQSLLEKHNIAVTLTLKGNAENLNSRVEITLFRILQEALTNVVKHARASSVKVELINNNGEVSLIVEDNGSGMDASLLSAGKYQERLGLASIQERALLLSGTCKIESWQGSGTRISVTVPVPEKS